MFMSEAQLISIFLGLFIGFILAISGAGGGIFAIPILVFGLNLSITQSAPIALLAVVSAAGVGAIQGLKKGNVRYKTALLMAIFGIAFAPLGVWLAKRISTQYLSIVFAVILIYVATRMWKRDFKKTYENENNPPPACVLNPATSKLFWTAHCTKRLVAAGSLAGLLSGLLGVGGGFVIVPSLRKVSNFDIQTVIATSLTIIALVSAISVTTYVLQGDVNWAVAIPFVTSTVISMFAFRLISHKIPAQISQRSFAILAVIAALFMLIDSFK